VTVMIGKIEEIGSMVYICGCFELLSFVFNNSLVNVLVGGQFRVLVV